MVKKFFSLVTVIVGLILIPIVPFAAGPFEGKTIRFLVGVNPGGGLDTYARFLARHMGKHIPGNPTIYIENMPGAGGLSSLNYLYRVAKPDGLTIWHTSGGLLLNKLMGKPGAEFDSREFEFIGAIFKDSICCEFTKASGITSMEKWMASKTPVKMGAIVPGTMLDIVPNILKEELGLPIQVVTGYKGTPEAMLAAESGEVAGVAIAWESFRVVRGKALETGDWVVVLQTTPKRHPELPNVPCAINFAKTQEARQLIEVGINDVCQFTRPWLLPPGTPKELVEILRKAFQETLRDTEFVAEAQKMRMDISPVTGDELKQAMLRVFNLDPVLLAKLRDVAWK
jgi:tripartite-type tricarboxylate transporter receptor subunit TctC